MFSPTNLLFSLKEGKRGGGQGIKATRQRTVGPFVPSEPEWEAEEGVGSHLALCLLWELESGHSRCTMHAV